MLAGRLHAAAGRTRGGAGHVSDAPSDNGVSWLAWRWGRLSDALLAQHFVQAEAASRLGLTQSLGVSVCFLCGALTFGVVMLAGRLLAASGRAHGGAGHVSDTPPDNGFPGRFGVGDAFLMQCWPNTSFQPKPLRGSA